MILTFPNKQLQLLLNSAKVRWPLGLRECYGDDVQGSPEEGFWLVGDEGVYLMHNGTLPNEALPLVVYANECNPETMEFDDWWAAKNATFGADDGVEFIPRATIEGIVASGNDLEVLFTSDLMSVGEVITDTADPMHRDNRGFDGPTGAE